MILLVISFSALLLWAACGFVGLPAKAQASTHVMFPMLMVIAVSSIYVARVAIS
jgi:uncharacterized membrane protein YtjA (UPF0391 family)